MTHRARRLYPFVIFASPVLHPFNVRHSSRSPGPAARWIAPSTPPPPRSELFAALTIASTFCLVMSPSMMKILSDIRAVYHITSFPKQSLGTRNFICRKRCFYLVPNVSSRSDPLGLGTKKATFHYLSRSGTSLNVRSRTSLGTRKRAVYHFLKTKNAAAMSKRKPTT